jgi:hypothetical protein
VFEKTSLIANPHAPSPAPSLTTIANIDLNAGTLDLLKIYSTDVFIVMYNLTSQLQAVICDFWLIGIQDSRNQVFGLSVK